MDQFEAARAVLIEVVNILGAFKDDLVIVGGWVPDLTYPDRRHMGSLDVDLAIGPGAVGSDAYSTILGRLSANGYSHRNGPTHFLRSVPGVAQAVKVDLITGEYVNDEKSRAIQVNELRLNCLRGVDLAFEFCEEIKIEGTMPDGTHNAVRARIVRPEAFILMKSFTLADRKKEKDAYDIAFILHHYQPTIAALAARVDPLIKDGLGAEAFQIFTGKFATLDSVGPSWSADVAAGIGQDREQSRQAAFQDSQELIEEIRRIQGTR